MKLKFSDFDVVLHALNCSYLRMMIPFYACSTNLFKCLTAGHRMASHPPSKKVEILTKENGDPSSYCPRWKAKGFNFKESLFDRFNNLLSACQLLTKEYNNTLWIILTIQWQELGSPIAIILFALTLFSCKVQGGGSENAGNFRISLQLFDLIFLDNLPSPEPNAPGDYRRACWLSISQCMNNIFIFLGLSLGLGLFISFSFSLFQMELVIYA